MIIKRILYGKTYCAIEHTTIGSTEVYTILVLRYKKKSFDLVYKSQVKSLDEIPKLIKQNQHVFLIFNNAKVLSKKIDEVYAFSTAISKAYPNIKTDDFYIEILEQKQDQLISLIRKNEVDSILAFYEKHKINSIGYTIGNGIVYKLLPYVDGASIETSNALIRIKDSTIETIQKALETNHKTICINGLTIDKYGVLPLSGILRYFSGQREGNILNNNSEQRAELIRRFKLKRFFSLSLTFGLTCIFLVLLINFLLFSHFSSKVDALSSNLTVNESAYHQLMKFQKTIELKRGLVKEIESISDEKVSYYVDALGASIPNSIQLDKLEYQPLLKKISPLKEIAFESDVIFISGTSPKSIEFTTWINKLELLYWVGSVEVHEYGSGSKNLTAFELKIKMIK